VEREYRIHHSCGIMVCIQPFSASTIFRRTSASVWPERAGAHRDVMVDAISSPGVINMRRREFVAGLAGVTAWPFTGQAQPLATRSLVFSAAERLRNDC
jgi:hypothetical protein